MNNLEYMKAELRRRIRRDDRSKDTIWFEFVEEYKLTYDEEVALQEIVDAE